MIKVLLGILFFCSTTLAAKTVGYRYVNTPFAILHSNPSRYSSALTTITCSFAVKLTENSSVVSQNSLDWIKVTAGEFSGHIQLDHISTTRPECPQSKYPEFMNSLNLDLNELYYWGKLQDQWIVGRSKVQ